MSKSYDNLRQDLIVTANEPDYRHAYGEQSTDLSIGTQIKVLREQRGWRQEDLAEHAEIRQPMVSRYENVYYGNWTLNTLKKLAKAYDVWLDIRFRSFGDLVKETEGFSRTSLEVPKFQDDPYFWKAKRKREILRKTKHGAMTFLDVDDNSQMKLSFEKTSIARQPAKVVSISEGKQYNPSTATPGGIYGRFNQGTTLTATR